MGDLKATPGPWAVTARNSRRVTRQGKMICTAVLHNCASGAKDEAEAEANAHLIAAAPELYEALKLVVQRCGPNSTDGAIGRAALAKARGEHPQSIREGVDRD